MLSLLVSTNPRVAVRSGVVLGVIAIQLMILLATGCADREKVTEALRAEIPRRTGPVPAAHDPYREQAWKQMERFYAEMGEHPAWFDREQALAAVTLLETSDQDGFRPRWYGVPELTDAVRRAHESGARPPLETRIELDVRLTTALMLYGHHAIHGRVSPDSLDPDWIKGKDSIDVARTLFEGRRRHRVAEALRGLQPSDSAYVALRRALARVRATSAQPPLGALPVGSGLQHGARGPAVELLREYLVRAGSLRPEWTGAVYDSELVAAARAYQSQHGLKVTGSIDAATAASLAVPGELRVQAIEANMERWRWLPRELGDRHIAVNIPDYSLAVVTRGAPTVTLRVVTGQKDWETPLFSSQVEGMTIHPSWIVPSGILTRELLPGLARDSLSLQKAGLQVERAGRGGYQVVSPSRVDWSGVSSPRFRYRVRQVPGADNPLGEVKFYSPNEFGVYLHDTSSRWRFRDRMRALSHGCVRVERPWELASLLWGHEAAGVESVVVWRADSLTRMVRFPQPVPLHLCYWTAWVDTAGACQFRPDVYGIDRRLTAAIEQRRTDAFQLYRKPESPAPAAP